MSAVEPSTRRHGRPPKVTDPVIARFAPTRKGKGKASQPEVTIRTPTPTQRTPTPQPRKHTCCDNPNITSVDDALVCTNCFTQIADSNIVAEVEFGEDSRGAATLQGGYIGENARHASTLGQAAQNIPGGVQKSAGQIAADKCKAVLNRLCTRLAIKDRVANYATLLYDLAVKGNFCPGRRTDEVVGACLYSACRQDPVTEKEKTMIMLIDIAECLQIGVYRLGEVYKDLVKDLFLDPGIKKQKAINAIPVVHVESLVMKFCRKLEFGAATERVAEDAMKIISRMKRDWMVTGRHPAGLCGAAIVLAARMNNFRRSVREVVWVVKVTDITILKRVMEFRQSRAQVLTVDQFREIGTRLKGGNDPPAMQAAEIRKQQLEKTKRKRQEASEARETAEVQDDCSGGSGNEENDERRKRRRTTEDQSATPAPTQQEPRRDADGFLIPALPAENARPNAEQQGKRKRGRPKAPPPPPIDLSEEELITEKVLKDEIMYIMDSEETIETATQVEIAKAGEYAQKIAPQYKKDDAEQIRLRREAEEITWVGAPPLNEEITAEELEKEFEDDPEVQRCLLSKEEQNAKELIWVINNEDWLRQQAEKEMLEKVTKAAGRNEKGKRAGKVGKKRRKGKIGDGTLLKNAREDGDTPIETPADATAVMLRERSTYLSGFINEAALLSMFRRPSSSSSRSSSAQNGENSSEGPSPANAGADVADDGSSSARSTPAPTSDAGRMRSPPVTQQGAEVSTATDSPEHKRAELQPPATPSQTRAQAAGAAADEESEGDEDDYLQDDELDYGSDHSSPADVGDDDYNRALSPTNRLAVDEDAYGDDDYF